MIMMVVTVKVVPLVVLLADQNLVMTVNLILLLTDLSAVIQHGMSMVLTAPHLKALMAGIVQAVLVLAMVIQFEEMDLVTVMKPMKHAQMIVMHLVNVKMAI